jgi:tight adherence protein B
MMFIAAVLMGLSVATLAYFIVPAWDELSTRYVKDLTPRLSALDVDQHVVLNLMRWWGISLCAVLFFIGVVWGKFIIAAGIFLILISIPRFVLDQMIEKRRIKIRDQLVAAAVGLANTTRAGLTLAQGFANISTDIPEPLGVEFRRVVRNYESGQPLKQAIRDIKQRLDIESFNIFSSSILVALEQGGNISQALDKISTGLAELQRLERNIESSTAGGKRLTAILALFPLAFLVGFYLMDPASVGLLFSTLIGQFILLAIGFLVFIAIRWCFFILDIDV